ncbi:MAG: TIGR04150 pseudo-rSAM protein [Cytophagales bacterium]|nr:TIGR04150 pseudo-rSAM protein [Cytophagales bacterium]
MKKFWLVLFPDTFLWIKNGQGIIYNSINFRHFTFCCSDDIKKLCDTIVDLDSLYSVEITDSLLCNKQVRQWVDAVTSMDAGVLIEQNGRNKKMVSYYPYLKIQDNKDHILWEHNLNIGGRIIQNLDELIFYINGSANGSDQLFRQTNYPLDSTMSLKFEQIESFVTKCRNGSISKITFVGDLLNYTDLHKLKKWIHTNDYFIHLVLLADDFQTDLTTSEWFSSERITVEIVINDYTSLDQLEYLEDFSDKVSWKFPINSVAQFESANTGIYEKELNDYDIIPIYNGRNATFFEAHVFMTKDEFCDLNLSRREVFINMALNINYFGKLTIMPNGIVYANVNREPLGNTDTPIYDMVFKEMTDGRSWLRIRDYEPCRNCLYQWLCPSPGNYELVMGTPNLCHVFSPAEKADKAVMNC